MNEAKGLIVELDLETRKFDRALQKARQAQRRSADQMEKAAKRNADQMADNYEGMGNRLQAAFAKINPAAIIGTLTGIGMTRALGNVRDVMRQIAEIGNEAARSGLGTDQFQQLRYVAAQARIPVDALVDGIKELNIRGDEFVTTGAGGGAEAFERLGYSARDLAQRLKEPDELFLDIIKRMEGLDRAAQIRVADEIFGGTGGERFVELLGRGEAHMRDMMQRATDLGITWSEETIARMDEVDRRFGEMALRAENLAKRAAVGMADFTLNAIDEWNSGVAGAANARAEIAERQAQEALRNRASALLADPGSVAMIADEVGYLERAVAGLTDLEEDRVRAAEDLVEAYRLAGVQAADTANLIRRAASDADFSATTAEDQARVARLREIADLIEESNAGLRDGTTTSAEFVAEVSKLAAEANKVQVELGGIDGATFSGVLEGVTNLILALGRAAAAARAVREEVQAGQAAASQAQRQRSQEDRLEFEVAPPAVAPGRPEARPQSIDFGYNPDPSSGGSGGGGGGSNRDSYGDAVERLQREQRALEAEAAALIASAAAGRRYGDAVEFARTRAELLVAAQEAGREITPALTAEIDRLAEAHVAAGKAAEDAADRLEEGQERQRRGAEAMTSLFSDILTGAKSAEEAVAGLLRQIGEAMIQRSLMAAFTGPLSGISSFFGGALAGPTKGFAEGGFTGPGGKHQPAGIVHAGEFVFSASSVARLGAANLEALHQSAKNGALGFASGGLVGRTGKAAMASSDSLRASGRASAPTISISAPITVNASGGTPEQNADLASQMASQTERMFRNIVQEEMLNQMRPGGMLT